MNIFLLDLYCLEPSIFFALKYAIAEENIVDAINININSLNMDSEFGIIAKTVANVLGTNTAVPITVSQRIIIERRFVIFV